VWVLNYPFWLPTFNLHWEQEIDEDEEEDDDNIVDDSSDSDGDSDDEEEHGCASLAMPGAVSVNPTICVTINNQNLTITSQSMYIKMRKKHSKNYQLLISSHVTCAIALV